MESSFDHSVFLKRYETNPARKLKILNLYNEYMPQYLNEARKAFAEMNFKTMDESVHTIKGTLSAFEAYNAIADAQKIMEAARNEDEITVKTYWPVLEKKLEILTKEINELLSE